LTPRTIGEVNAEGRYLRYLITALDIAGAGLLAGGLCLLASLAHPYLAITVAGALCLAVAFVLEPGKRGLK